MVAPPQQTSITSPQQTSIMTINETLARIQELRRLIREMEIHPEYWGTSHPQSIDTYRYYLDELDNLETQMNNLVVN